MIRKVLIAALAVAFAQSAGAQSLQDLIRNALESLSGKTSEESAAPAAVAEPLAATELPGVWNYRAPALEYTGDDMLASLATSTLRGQLPAYYAQAGLQPDKATVTFARDNKFRAALGDRKVEGTYRYDATTGALTVEYLLAGKTVKFTGRAKHADGVLTLLFEANAALASLRASSPQAAQDQRLQQIAAILERYPGVMLGVELKR